MDVDFYRFSKKPNSTARPTGDPGLSTSCRVKSPMDILHPIIELRLQGDSTANPTTYNYAHIAALSRYYRIQSWKNDGPIWEAELVIDSLASWRGNIGSQSAYVMRSSYSWNNKIRDGLYPVTCRQHKLNVDLPAPFTVTQASASGAAKGTGIFVLGILNGSGMDYYGFTETQLSAFMNYLFSSAYYNAVLTEFGATEYPEAKVAINPMQYIASAKYVPMGIVLPPVNQMWCLKGSTITGVYVGSVMLNSQTAYVFKLAGQPVDYCTTVSYIDLPVTADFLHPQADDRGDWLNFAPTTMYEINYPPFGLIQLDPAEISAADDIRIQLTTDVRTCIGMLDVILDAGTTKERTICRVTASIGADIPLTNILETGHSTMDLVGAGIAALDAAINLQPAQFLNAEKAAVRTMVDGWIPHLSTAGGQGSTAAMGGSPCLYVTHWYVANDDLTDNGRPLCDTRTISNIPGFIMAHSDGLSIPCTAPELQEIRFAFESGFFYE